MFERKSRVQKRRLGRNVLLTGTVMSAALIGLTLHSQRVEAACSSAAGSPGVDIIDCSGATTDTINAGNGADTLTATEVTGNLTFNGEGNNDTITIDGGLFQFDSGGSIATGGGNHTHREEWRQPHGRPERQCRRR